MQANVSGVIVFTTPDGVDVIMSYDPLETFDWVLLTILPADIISHDTDAYIRIPSGSVPRSSYCFR